MTGNDPMELLAEISDKDVGANKGSRLEHEVSWDKRMSEKVDKDITSYYRGAARAIVLNSKREMVLQHAAKYDYYKLPGGGIGNGEDTISALHREVMEEAGCRIDVLEPVGLIIEHRERLKLTQISYCYLAKIKGKQGKTHLEEGEKQEGFEPQWWSMRKALHLVENGYKDSYMAKFMVKRDAIFIKKAMELLSV